MNVAAILDLYPEIGIKRIEHDWTASLHFEHFEQPFNVK